MSDELQFIFRTTNASDAVILVEVLDENFIHDGGIFEVRGKNVYGFYEKFSRDYLAGLCAGVLDYFIKLNKAEKND